MAHTVEFQRKHIVDRLAELQRPPRNVEGEALKGLLESVWEEIRELCPFISDAERIELVHRYEGLENAYLLASVFQGGVDREPLPEPQQGVDALVLDEQRSLLEEIEGDIGISERFGGVNTAALKATCRNLRRELLDAHADTSVSH